MKKNDYITIRVDPTLRRAIIEVSKKMDRSMSSQLRAIVKEWMDQNWKDRENEREIDN